MAFQTERKASYTAKAGLEMRLLSSLEGAPIIKKDFGEGQIISHNYNGTPGLVRSREPDAGMQRDASHRTSK